MYSEQQSYEEPIEPSQHQAPLPPAVHSDIHSLSETEASASISNVYTERHSYAQPYIHPAGSIGPPKHQAPLPLSIHSNSDSSALLQRLNPELREKVESCLLDPNSLTVGAQVGKGQSHLFSSINWIYLQQLLSCT